MSGRGGRGGGNRGAYYKARYGGGRGRGGGAHHVGAFNHSQQGGQSSANSGDWDQLAAVLRSVDGQSYPAYKQLLGKFTHQGPDFTLAVDHVQGDAYAPPSRVRAIMPWNQTGFPSDYLQNQVRRIALGDYVTRMATAFIRGQHLDQGNAGSGWSGPKGGAFNINAAGQEVLPRTSAVITGEETIELRFTVALPAAGRSCLGQQAFQILGVNLVKLVSQSLLHSNLDQAALRKHVISVENQHHLRNQLQAKGLIAFVANGSILPRASGASSAPMKSNVVPFESPKEHKVTMTLNDGTKVTGMGIPKGITLLTGGGFHGKSTLLEAIELGVYDHIPNDGRELIVSDPAAVKIRAEDGRSVTGIDISPFIRKLPGGKDTKQFTTTDASGSTSMAANIQEALEAGSTTLLIDEDSSATNLLVRDQRMQKLIQNEPITPLVSKVRALYAQHGVSTIMVVGGLGDWLSVADHIICLDSYLPRSLKSEAEAVLAEYPVQLHQDETYGTLPSRSVQLQLPGDKPPLASSKHFISVKPAIKDPVSDPSAAADGIDLSGLDQIVEVGQARTVAHCLQTTRKATEFQAISLPSLLAEVEKDVSLDKCLPGSLQNGDLVAARRFEIAAVLSRFRGLKTK
ncbi:hypothetical protein MBLNU230_g0971t1 [Neophaeotheca triangularis]